MSYNLYLDDIRNPEMSFMDFKNPIYVDKLWVIVRSYHAFVKEILENGLPDCVSFDHDLADAHYHESMFKDGKVYMKYIETVSEKTGHDCVKWLVDYCIDHEKPFPEWYLHTANPVGRENMKAYILNYLKHSA